MAKTRQWRLVEQFFPDASTLQLQVQWHLTELTRVPSRAELEFEQARGGLIGPADLLLGQNVLQNFLGCLRDWGTASLGAHHASTPRLQIVTRGCQRAMLAEPSPATWHYLFALHRAELTDPGDVTLVQAPSSCRFMPIRVSRTSVFKLAFNHLLVHRSGDRVGIRTPSSPWRSHLEAPAYLDGHLW